MVRTEHSIVSQVYAAKTDPEAADALIGQYMGFIRSETVKFTHTAPEDGREDELSIAMLAFYESILGYEKSRGAFLAYAARAIRNRLIDHYRVAQRHGKVISLHAPAEEEPERSMLETLPDSRDEIGAYDLRAASREEIQEFGRQLAMDASQEGPGVLLVVKSELWEEASAQVSSFGVLTLGRPFSRGALAQALGLLAASQARLRECQQENARLRQKLEELRIISRAKCLLVEYLHLSEEQAHKYMERQAMEERKTRRAVAEEVLREYG